MKIEEQIVTASESEVNYEQNKLSVRCRAISAKCPVFISSLLGFTLFLLMLIPSFAFAANVCFCHQTGSTTNPFNTICTSNSGQQNGHAAHGDPDFGCQCGDNVCDSGSGETCGTCPQDCGACPACGDGNADDGEECGDPGTSPGACTAPETCEGCRCVPPPSICGNNIQELGEECDGTDNALCGDLGCTAACQCNEDLCINVVCNDNNPCTDDSCDPGSGCHYTNDNSNICTDSDECSIGDHCVSGSCIAGAPKVCDDGRSCSTDQCIHPTGLCDFNLEGCACSTDSDCNDNNPCTDDSCSLDSGTCSNTPNDANSCSDSNACTGGDHCSGGSCIGSTITCDDNNPCTDDTCNPASGCAFNNDDSNTCSDANECSIGDHCYDGSCVPGIPKVCDDGRSCSTDQCIYSSGLCDYDLENCACSVDLDCNDSNPCTDDSCDLNSGTCSNTSNDTNACSDNNACTGNDHCSAGSCVGSAAICDDNNPCTDDSCDPASGCQVTNDDSNTCTDSDECSIGDHCVSGSCVPGAPKVCDDGRSCSFNQCLSPGGDCVYNLEQCRCGSNEDCNDNNPCTDNLCDPDSGTCSNPGNRNSCDDGNACTTGDQCSDGICQGISLSCDDGNACTHDSCGEGGICVNFATIFDTNFDNGSCITANCPDTDVDGVCDDVDDCPTTANADQADADGDGLGDVCDVSAQEGELDGKITAQQLCQNNLEAQGFDSAEARDLAAQGMCDGLIQGSGVFGGCQLNPTASASPHIAALAWVPFLSLFGFGWIRRGKAIRA